MRSGVEHWHGATPQSGLPIWQGHPLRRGKTIWLEPVSSSLYYRKRPRGGGADRRYDEQIVVACGEKPGQRRRYQRGRVTLRQYLSCLGVNRTAAHSPTTFFRISISSDFRPSVRSSCRMR